MNDRLSQPQDLMFERNVGHIAKRGREVEIWIEGIPQSKTGFLAGLDDDFIQMCISKSGTLSNVRRDMIVSMDETGVTIGTMIRDSRGTIHEGHVLKIKEKVNHFQKKAEAIYGGVA